MVEYELDERELAIRKELLALQLLALLKQDGVKLIKPKKQRRENEKRLVSRTKRGRKRG